MDRPRAQRSRLGPTSDRSTVLLQARRWNDSPEWHPLTTFWPWGETTAWQRPLGAGTVNLKRLGTSKRRDPYVPHVTTLDRQACLASIWQDMAWALWYTGHHHRSRWFDRQEAEMAGLMLLLRNGGTIHGRTIAGVDAMPLAQLRAVALMVSDRTENMC